MYSCKHDRTTRQHDVATQIVANCSIALHDRLECGVVDLTFLLRDKSLLEQNLRVSEKFTFDVAAEEFISLLLLLFLFLGDLLRM